jgi:hypothetical protein
MEIIKGEFVIRILEIDTTNPTQIHFDHISSNYAFFGGKRAYNAIFVSLILFAYDI